MLVTSRDVHGSASRRPGMSGTVAVVPVASTTACRAIRVRTQPSVPMTSTDFSPASRPWPADHVDTGAVRPLHLAGVVVVVGERVPPAQHRGSVDAVIADDAGHPGHVPGGLEHLDRPQQRLARHAGPVGALAAEQLVLDDHRRPVAALDRVLRGDLPGRAAADHDDVVGVAFRRYRFGFGHADAR